SCHALELAQRAAAGRRGRELPRALKSVEAVQLRQRTKQSRRWAIQGRVPDADKLPPVQTGAHVGLKALRKLLQQIVQEAEMSETNGRTRPPGRAQRFHRQRDHFRIAIRAR